MKLTDLVFFLSFFFTFDGKVIVHKKSLNFKLLNCDQYKDNSRKANSHICKLSDNSQVSAKP